MAARIPDTIFSSTEIGEERALERSTPSSRMVFGLGPPAHEGDRDARARRILSALEDDVVCLRWGHQVHGRDIETVRHSADRGLPGAAVVGTCDGLVTAESGVALMVWTADCVPVLLEAPGVVAAVHSGWRGTAADIVGAAVRRLEDEHGASPENIVAVLGPAISGPRYEVAAEVVEALLSVGELALAEDLPPAELAAWTSTCRAILNLHETITRP